MTYGQAESNLTYGYDIDATNKLVNDDTAATVLSGITYTNSAYKDATHTNNVGGTYTVTVNVPNLKNYSVTTNTGAVTMSSQDYSRAVTSLIPRHGNQIVTPLYGVYVDQPASTVTTQTAQMEAVAEEQNATVTLNAEQPNGTVVTSPKRQQELNGGYYIDLDGKRHQLF